MYCFVTVYTVHLPQVPLECSCTVSSTICVATVRILYWGAKPPLPIDTLHPWLAHSNRMVSCVLPLVGEGSQPARQTLMTGNAGPLSVEGPEWGAILFLWGSAGLYPPANVRNLAENVFCWGAKPPRPPLHKKCVDCGFLGNKAPPAKAPKPFPFFLTPNRQKSSHFERMCHCACKTLVSKTADEGKKG